MAPTRVAIIGYGLSAKIFHIPFILSLPSHFTLHGILQRTPTPSNSAASDHPNIKIYNSLEPLLADPEVDLVVISSIPSVHFEHCKKALEAGKHVLCEKPFVPTSAEASELASIAQKHGKQLAVYQNRRFDADYLQVKGLLEAGRLGRVVDVQSHFDRHRPDPPAKSKAGWKARGDEKGVGAVYDLGSHLIDQTVGLWGMPQRVTGFVGNQRVYTEEGTGGEAGGDSFTILLQYRSGMLVTLRAGVVSAEKKMLRWWIRGDKGSFWKYGLDVQEDQLKAGMRPGDEGYGIEGKEWNAVVTSVDQGSAQINEETLEQKKPPVTYVGFYEELAKALEGKGKVPVSASEAAEVLRVIELAKESSDTGRTIEV